MSQEDATSNGSQHGSEAPRLRRPALERTEPRRGWGNLYAPGKSDVPAASRAAAVPPPAAPEASPPAAMDSAARVVRDGYRIVEENLRRGRQVAAELRGLRRETIDAPAPADAPRVVSQLTQTLLDPALTEQVLGVARSFLSTLGAALPGPIPTPAAETRTPLPLHPQERPDYAPVGARVLKLRSTAPGEWLADLEIDGKVRRVQVRAVDGDL